MSRNPLEDKGNIWVGLVHFNVPIVKGSGGWSQNMIKYVMSQKGVYINTNQDPFLWECIIMPIPNRKTEHF